MCGKEEERFSQSTRAVSVHAPLTVFRSCSCCCCCQRHKHSSPNSNFIPTMKKDPSIHSPLLLWQQQYCTSKDAGTGVQDSLRSLGSESSTIAISTDTKTHLNANHDRSKNCHEEDCICTRASTNDGHSLLICLTTTSSPTS